MEMISPPIIDLSDSPLREWLKTREGGEATVVGYSFFTLVNPTHWVVDGLRPLGGLGLGGCLGMVGSRNPFHTLAKHLCPYHVPMIGIQFFHAP